MKLTFSEEVNMNKFGYPDRLKPKKTVTNLIPTSYNTLEHRVIESISWNSDYSRIEKLENQIHEEQQERKNKKEWMK